MEKLLTTEYLPDTVIPDTAIPDTAIPDTDTPKWQSASTSREETLSYLEKNPALFQQFRQLKEDWRESFLAFMEGKGSLPLTYDPFFKKIFHPDIHRERLESLLSSLLGMKIKIKAILPNEDSMITGENLLIMDLLVELEDGSLSDLEIQRQPYSFPSQRISCYSSDLLMRQYARLKGERGKNFGYQDIKKVYVIVIYQKSTRIFSQCQGQYIHHGKVRFDTGLDLELLQEYTLVALDALRKNMYPKEKNTLHAWLSLLSTNSIEDAEHLITDYPWMEEIYEEIAMLRNKPEEVLGMWSEALRILDYNSLKYYVEELQQEIDEKTEALAQKDDALAQKDDALAQKDDALAQKDDKIKELTAMIEEFKKQLLKS